MTLFTAEGLLQADARWRERLGALPRSRR